jgi:hypothetical protein
MFMMDVRGWLTAVEWRRGPGDVLWLDPHEVGLVYTPVPRRPLVTRGTARRLGLRKVTRP